MWRNTDAEGWRVFMWFLVSWLEWVLVLVQVQVQSMANEVLKNHYNILCIQSYYLSFITF